MIKAIVGAAIVVAVIGTTTPSGAHHDRIYGPCDTEYGFIHMTYDEFNAQVSIMEADGTIPPGVIFRYYEELHGGKGTIVHKDGTVINDPRVTWARNLVDGQILSLDWRGDGSYPEIEALMFTSGMVPEWILDPSGIVRRFNDPYWAQANPLTPTWTVWQTLCSAGYGRSIPVYETVNGIWTSNIPSTTTTTTTTTLPATTTIAPATTTVAPTPTPTVGLPLVDITINDIALRCEFVT